MDNPEPLKSHVEASRKASGGVNVASPTEDPKSASQDRNMVKKARLLSLSDEGLGTDPTNEKDRIQVAGSTTSSSGGVKLAEAESAERRAELPLVRKAKKLAVTAAAADGGTTHQQPVIAKAVSVQAPTEALTVEHLGEVQSWDLDQIRLERAKRKRLITTAPSWLISLLFHLGLILTLAAITLDPVQTMISILQASAGQPDAAIEDFQVQAPSVSLDDSLEDALVQPSATSDELAMPELTSPLVTIVEADVKSLEMNAITESIMPKRILQSSALAQLSTSLNSRSAAVKSEMLERFGGTAASEKAVALALKWLAAHQAPDGGWNFNHSIICQNKCKDGGDLVVARNAATAMALLPFLGAGQTHLEGQYKQSVKGGLAFLINSMEVTPSSTLPTGSWHEPGGSMYSHGLAAITMCEAYAMTRDPDLQQPAQLALNFLVYAQNEHDGGWRYSPKQPGDTSVVGWCLMALKSGKMGNLIVPDLTFRGVDGFLDLVSTNNGAYYGYNRPTSDLEGRQATIAVGLLCRMYLGYPKEHPGLQEGINYLSKLGPRTNDLYYSYYATQVLRHHGGSQWDTWNAKLREELVKSQEPNGHVAGSWAPSGSHSEKGGRLYQTSLAAMILEVYYRHMPLYSERSSAEDFEI